MEQNSTEVLKLKLWDVLKLVLRGVPITSRPLARPWKKSIVPSFPLFFSVFPPLVIIIVVTASSNWAWESQNIFQGEGFIVKMIGLLEALPYATWGFLAWFSWVPFVINLWVFVWCCLILLLYKAVTKKNIQVIQGSRRTTYFSATWWAILFLVCAGIGIIVPSWIVEISGMVYLLSLAGSIPAILRAITVFKGMYLETNRNVFISILGVLSCVDLFYLAVVSFGLVIPKLASFTIRHEEPVVQALRAASREGDISTIDKILQPSPELIKATRGRGSEIALLAATEHDQIEAVKYLLNRGANLKAKDYLDRTPLFLAAQKGHVELVQAFLKHGANLNAIPFFLDMSPLHVAAANGHGEIVALLTKNGAQVDSVGMDKRTPLHEAALNVYTESAQYLIAEGADINAKDIWGTTPLHNVCWVTSRLYYKHEITVADVLRARAKPNNKTVFTFREKIDDNVKLKFIEMLINNGAEVNSEDNCGLPPLNYVLNTDQNDAICDLLIKHGGRVRVTKDGSSQLVEIDRSQIGKFSFEPISDKVHEFLEYRQMQRLRGLRDDGS